MNLKPPHVLLVNPWIHDFAAYDFWAKPFGLLSLGAILKKHGLHISYIDCLNRFHPKQNTRQNKTIRAKRFGCGPYLKTPLPKPKGLNSIQRNYARYGILKEWFIEDLKSLPAPDIILVTSLMTYWYPGVFETIDLLKINYPNTPIILGGIYATLCFEHAKKFSNADEVIKGPGEIHLSKIIKKYTGYDLKELDSKKTNDIPPFPVFELQNKIPYIPILTSRGCPYKCAYCAASILNSSHVFRKIDDIVDEIIFWYEQYEVEDFAIYDDAFLVSAPQHALPFLDKIIKSGLNLRFHTPNALHIRKIDQKIAKTLYESGFKTIRLGLEIVDRQEKNLDEKVFFNEFVRAITYLKKAGFNSNDLGTYLLIGLPEQSLTEVENAIRQVSQLGATPILAYYSPIPGSKLWKQAVACSRFDLESDPIFTNNTIFPCSEPLSQWSVLSHFKALTKIL